MSAKKPTKKSLAKGKKLGKVKPLTSVRDTYPTIRQSLSPE